MCKIVTIKTIEKGKEANALKFAKAVTPFMCASDRDGFGYFALGSDGMFGERWLNPKDAWNDNKTMMSPAEEALLMEHQGFMHVTGLAAFKNSFGKKTQRMHTLALHSRMATCEKGLKNVHPFVNGNTAIIHNGAIDNPTVYGKRESTCDSEVILLGYDAYDIANAPMNLDEMVFRLDGWLASVALTQNSKGQWLLDVFKDGTNLHAVFVYPLNTIVFATDPMHVINACKVLKWKYGAIMKIEDYTHMRYDAVTGKVVFLADIDGPCGYKANPKVTTVSDDPIDNGLGEEPSYRNEDEPIDAYDYLRQGYR